MGGGTIRPATAGRASWVGVCGTRGTDDERRDEVTNSARYVLLDDLFAHRIRQGSAARRVSTALFRVPE